MLHNGICLEEKAGVHGNDSFTPSNLSGALLDIERYSLIIASMKWTWSTSFSVVQRYVLDKVMLNSTG